MPRSLEYRIAQLESQIEERKMERALANCTCDQPEIAVMFDGVVGEPRAPRCPIHGAQRQLITVEFVDPSSTETGRNR